MADTNPHTLTVRLGVAASAAGVDTSVAVARAPYDGYVSAARYIPNAAMNGAANPNNRTLRVVNKTTPTSGGVTATVTMDGTNNTAAFGTVNLNAAAVPVSVPRVDPASNYAQDTLATNYGGSNTYTAPTVTPTAASFSAGDVIDFESIHNGTGTADPGGTVEVVLQRYGNA